MEFQQLEIFAAVFEEGSVSRAADRVCRTAPAVSIALRKLEGEFGAPLFDRSERMNYQPTPAGKLLYSYATRILQTRTEATASLKSITRHQGTLRLGTHESTSLHLLPALIHAFNEAHPGVKTEIICGHTQRIMAALNNGAIELALIGDAPDDVELERHLIKHDELVLITSPEHRLSSLQQVHVRDLAGEFLIVQGTKSALRERVAEAFQQSDIPFNLGVENVAIEAIKRMVIEGLGIGFVPRLCVSEETASGKLMAMKVEGLRGEWNLSLVFRKDRPLSPTARSFVEVYLKSVERCQISEAPAIRNREQTIAPRRVRTKPFAIQTRKVAHC